MEKSITNAFTFMTNDRDWIYKLFILFMLILASTYAHINFVKFILKPAEMSIGINNLLDFLKFYFGYAFILFLIDAIVLPFITGYLATCAHNIMINKNDPLLLPNWEEKFLNYFVVGTKYSITIFFISTILIIPSLITLGFAYLAFLFFWPSLCCIFCENYGLKAFCSWKKAWSFIKKDTKLYLIISSFYAVCNILVPILMINFVLLFPVVFSSILISIVFTYLSLAFAYMIALLNTNENEIIFI